MQGKVVIKLSIFTPCFELKSCVKMGVTLASETTFPFSILILRLPLHIVIFFFKLPSQKLMSNEVLLGLYYKYSLYYKYRLMIFLDISIKRTVRSQSGSQTAKRIGLY